MVQVESSDYLSGKLAKEKGANRFTPLEEFTYKDGGFGKKVLQGKARLNGIGNAEGVLSLNKTSQRKCAELAGPDSKSWVNKSFDFVVTAQVVEGKLVDVIFVTGLTPA